MFTTPAATSGPLDYQRASHMLTVLGISNRDMMNAFRSLWDVMTPTALLDNGAVELAYNPVRSQAYPYRIKSFVKVPSLIGQRHMGDAYVIAQMSYDSERIMVLAERPHEYIIWTVYGADGFMSYHNGQYIPKSKPNARVIAHRRLTSAALGRAGKLAVYSAPTTQGN